jgi:hypothetical protein
MISEIFSSEKDEGALRKDKVKCYKEQIDYLQTKTFGIMFGIGARHAYAKTGKVKDRYGNTRLVSYGKSAARVGTKANIITHLRKATNTDAGEIANFDQRGADGIGFVYEHGSSTLTVKVKFKSCHLSEAKENCWIPCSDTFDNSPNAVERQHLPAQQNNDDHGAVYWRGKDKGSQD